MKFPVVHFLFLCSHAMLCLLGAMLLSLALPLYPVSVCFMLLLLPISLLSAYLSAQLFPFDGGSGS
jgi:hypothetical protein